MEDYIVNRTLREAEYIVDSRATVRDTAKQFGISKSTVHNDMKNKLQYVDKALYYKVREIMDENFAVRHIRGGESTKLKYLK